MLALAAGPWPLGGYKSLPPAGLTLRCSLQTQAPLLPCSALTALSPNPYTFIQTKGRLYGLRAHLIPKII